MNSVSAVDLDLVLVIFPDDTELDDAFWDGGDLESFLVFWVLLEEGRVLEGGGQLWSGYQFDFFLGVERLRKSSPELGFFVEQSKK